jgi:hypothetical protein
MNKEGIQLLTLRVFIFQDDGIYVAQCLETGSVATADDSITAKDMICELLNDEVEFALKHGKYTNLFSTPAKPEIWAEWFKKVREVAAVTSGQNGQPILSLTIETMTAENAK